MQYQYSSLTLKLSCTKKLYNFNFTSVRLYIIHLPGSSTKKRCNLQFFRLPTNTAQLTTEMPNVFTICWWNHNTVHCGKIPCNEHCGATTDHQISTFLRNKMYLWFYLTKYENVTKRSLPPWFFFEVKATLLPFKWRNDNECCDK